MGRRRVSQKDVSMVLAELKDLVAVRVRRSPARFDGSVEVRWEDTALERQQRKEDLRAWRLPFVVSSIGLLVVLATLILSLFSDWGRHGNVGEGQG